MHAVNHDVRVLHVLHAGSKLRSYALFKVSLSQEAHPTCVQGRHACKLLARFRIGVQQLRIETGMYELCGLGSETGPSRLSML